MSPFEHDAARKIRRVSTPRSPRQRTDAVNESFSVGAVGSLGMDRGQNTGGLMSSAGLVRYFDAEDSNAIRIDPKTVIALGVLLGVLVQLLTFVS